MNKLAYAVIGLNYGDEGKGLTTDFLTRKLTKQGRAPIVARGNGGAQAGHTVVTPDGRRHVFGHVGSGTFAGAHTYLASKFIINPYVLKMERLALEGHRADNTIIMAHQDCRITSIFDMALNSIRELSRGNGRHGSCGMGINETVTRHLAGHQLTLRMLATEPVWCIADRLEVMFDAWWEPELEKIRASRELTDDRYKPFLQTFVDRNFEKHANILRQVCDHLTMSTCPQASITAFGPDLGLIIEGAQGLALDEVMGEFPHVTRSITGLPSSVLAASEAGYNKIQPIYITRCYSTRHGAGPLVGDGLAFTKGEVPEDKTNVEGTWQGKIRFAPLNLYQIKELLWEDMDRANMLEQILGVDACYPQIMLTCLDQVGDEIGIIRDEEGTVEWVQKSELPKIIFDYVHAEVAYCSYGPTAEDIHEMI